MSKKLLATLLSVLMIISVIVPVSAANRPDYVGKNVAPDAKVSVSYGTTWNNNNAINDEKQSDPNGTYSQVAEDLAWGTWPEAGTQWVQYTWDTPVTIDSVDVLWHFDCLPGQGGGPGAGASLERPAKATLSYDDGTGSLVEISDVEVGVENAVSASNNGFNYASFAPITTTSLRLTMDASETSSGVGIVEWMVYEVTEASDDQDAVDKAASALTLNDKYITSNIELPSTGSFDTAITWESNNTAVIANDGTVTRPEKNTKVTLTATITKGGASATKSFEVFVIRDGIDGAPVSFDELAPVTTQTGVAPVLPETVKATLTNGEKADVAVRWDNFTSYDKAGTYTVYGVVDDTIIDTVVVRPKIVVTVVDYVITAVNPVKVTVEDLDNIPALPDTVTVVIANGALANETRPVVWDEYDLSDLESEGEIKVEGTVEGTDIKAVATFTTEVIARPVYFNQVKINDDFWYPILKRDILVTIPHCVAEVEGDGDGAGGGWDSFLEIAKKRDGLDYEPIKSGNMVFTDSDVHKTVEAMSIALEIDPQGDQEIIAGQEWIRNKLEEWVPIIVKAQIPDGPDAGYLNAWYELSCDRGEDKMWSDYSDHELYVAGHFIESAVSHYRAFNGQDTRLYDEAIRLADYLCNKFETLNEVPGHEEIEVALIKLGNLRNEIMQDGSGDRYVNLAKIFIDRRGNSDGRPSGYYGGTYSQDNIPVKDATEAVGHSVRFGYFMMAVTDVAINGDEEYIPALDRLWRNCVDTKMYITGATGTSGNGSDSEGFGPSYYLPDNSAYAETCATISNMKWAQRMNQLHGDSEYADVMERVLYNGFLHGIGIDGDSFLYTNPLQGRATRFSWHNCACCPPNVARTIASVSEYAYVQAGRELRANAYMGSTAHVNILGREFTITQNTRYPYDGAINFAIETAEENQPMKLKLRIPSWFPGQDIGFTVSLNGEEITDPVMEQGYVVIDRDWNTGDTVDLNLDMDVLRFYENENVDFAQGKVALTRGPIVYSFESNDNPDATLTSIALPQNAWLHAEDVVDDTLGGEVVKITTDDGLANTISTDLINLTAIPYYLTHNRGGSIVTHIYEANEVVGIEADKTALIAAIEEANKLNGEDYAAPSWGLLQEALATANALNEDELSLQSAVDAAAEALIKAIANLVPAGQLDTTALKALIDEGKALDQYMYTEESWKEFEENLMIMEETYNLIMEDPNGWTQEDVDMLTLALESYFDDLVEAPQANKEELKAVLDEVKALDSDIYIPSTWDELVPVYNNALQVYERGRSTQDEVDQAAEDLRKAIDNLREIPVVDKRALETAVRASFEQYTANGQYWTEEGESRWSYYYDIGWNILWGEDPYYTQEQIDQLIIDLNAAVEYANSTMIVPGDNSELVALIATAKAITADGYTEESYAALQTAIASAETVAANSQATQATIDAEIEKLQAAIDALETVVSYKIVSIDGNTDLSKPAVAEVNKNITVVFNAPFDAWDIALRNEYGKDISRSIVDVVEEDDGTLTWTITFNVGTKGLREISLYADTGDGLADTGIDINLSIVAEKPVIDDTIPVEVIDVSAPRVAMKNNMFEVTVVTSSTTSNIGVFNEYGSDMGKTIVSKNIDGDTATWVFKMSVGSKGMRDFTIKACDAYGNWSDTTQQFKINIV